ncbi:oligopeptide transporter 4-like [Gossypium australe]|uniref:Oligopeptide transporter 4-like n=1 Tax=Gossypium australe TaxID=47621 RepID=A0A5B6VMX1_9ROSI|nr:oligopeptide transporter 4-like [Gossypium australe]
MIQNNLQFWGNIMEDSNQHLKRFLQLCDTFKYDGVTDYVIRLLLFPFSFSITTWDELPGKFLHKNFPISRTIQLRRGIANFKQIKGENLYKAKCPYHGIQEWLQLQIFYNGLDGSLRAGLDGASSGAFMNNTYERAC